MAGTKEIQSRIKSVQDTMKITNAMYMICLLYTSSDIKCLWYIQTQGAIL